MIYRPIQSHDTLEWADFEWGVDKNQRGRSLNKQKGSGKGLRGEFSLFFDFTVSVYLKPLYRSICIFIHRMRILNILMAGVWRYPLELSDSASDILSIVPVTYSTATTGRGRLPKGVAKRPRVLQENS
jgi:hypothetical protein